MLNGLDCYFTGTKTLDLHNWQIQLRKGLLELVVLSLLQNGPRHGYEMVQALKRIEGLTIREGNIYPILARLQIDGLVECYSEASRDGPQRKYFSLTKSGKRILNEMNTHWEQIIKSIRFVREGKNI